ncbi:alpha/beta fold hydrolase [Labilibacter marinus]|uniref:alpha/beta fold hydrolase n=1 Tax=Labilibacter marinus TaxID=1477105 RepID=UPI00094FACBC|nr:alpha/beta hydrolase [Labilibacter marinus]
MTDLIKNKVWLDDREFVYHEGGEGTPILFIHGISTYSFIWRKVIPYFIPNYKVIVIDLLGCGDSDLRTDVSFGLINQAKYMHLLMEALKHPKYHLISHDVGGGIAQVMSVQKPETLLSVSMINSVAYDFWPVQPIVSMRTPVLRQLAIATLDTWTLKIIIKKGLYHSNSNTAELFEYFRKPFKTKEGRKAFLHFASSLDNADLLNISDDLHQSNLNFLIIRGETDAYLSTSITQKLVENLKHCESNIIPTAGHYAMEDEPEMIANILTEFIEKHE